MRLGYPLALLVAMGTVGLVGCAPKGPETPQAKELTPAKEPALALGNAVCPITTDSVDPTKTAVWRDVTIGFCCESCVREFRDADEKGKDEILAKARAGK